MLQQTVKLGMRAMPSKDGIVQSEGLVLGQETSEKEGKLLWRASEADPHSIFAVRQAMSRLSRGKRSASVTRRRLPLLAWKCSLAEAEQVGYFLE